MVATMRGSAGHDIVEHALTALRNLDHRGATGADPLVGDGAGILTQVPDAFLRGAVDFPLPAAGAYAVGLAFLPRDADERAAAVTTIEAIAAEEGLKVLGWRDVPVVGDLVGEVARACMPHFAQLFVGSSVGRHVGIDLDRLAFCLRKRAERETEVYFASLSSRTLVYKGMLTTGQLEPFFPDLSDRAFETELALVHSRFSTNTFPSWPLAHPYRFIAHNGEINTVKGNRNWMRARESLLTSDIIPGNLERIFPVCTPDASDSASFDEVLELLHLGGRSLPHAVLMMIPEAWENNPDMDPARRAFYEFHATFMEPWDGPACVTFTDGTLIGAVLDRNGLRPGRYAVTDDGLVVLASESGVLDLDPSRVGQARPAPAREDVPRRHRARPDHRRRGDQVRARLAPPVRGVAARRADQPHRPARARAHRAHHVLGRPPPADLRLHPGGAARPARPDGPHRRGADRLDGHRHPDRRALQPSAAGLRLLHPALRAGDQPAARRDPRGARHLARHDDRPRGQRLSSLAGARPAGPARLPGDRQRRAGQDRPHQRRRRPAGLRHPRRARPVRRHRRRRGAAGADRGDLRRGQPGHPPRRPVHRPVRPRLRPRARADPVAAADRGGAPPPHAGEDPHPGRPARRGRRRARGAPRRAAHRVRRRGRQPLPGHGDRRGPRALRHPHRGRRRRRRWRTSSRRSARACSR